MPVRNERVPPAVRTPDPLTSSRRRALERLRRLRAMGLGAIGDIGSVQFGTVQTLTWETATDWDNAVTENSVVHDSHGDHAGDGTVQLGVLYNDETDLELSLAFDADSGTTVTDYSSNANDGSLSGPTRGAAGIANTDTVSFDGSDDSATAPDIAAYDMPGTYTVAFWIYVGNQSNTDPFLMSKGSEDYEAHLQDSSGEKYFRFIPTTDLFIDYTGHTYSEGTWYHVFFAYDDSQIGSSAINAYVDGNSVSWTNNGSGTVGDALTNNNLDLVLGRRHPDTANILRFTGRLEDFRWYSGFYGGTKAAELYGAGSAGDLTTATKTFSTATAPDLQNLSYSLNSQTITLDVIGSPGTGSEETVSQTLDGSTSYALSWSNTHTDFRVKINMSTTDPTTSPTLDRVELST